MVKYYIVFNILFLTLFNHFIVISYLLLSVVKILVFIINQLVLYPLTILLFFIKDFIDLRFNLPH